MQLPNPVVRVLNYLLGSHVVAYTTYQWPHEHKFASDRLLFWTATDLEMKLIVFRNYHRSFKESFCVNGVVLGGPARSKA
jgi:hypothetical protein